MMSNHGMKRAAFSSEIGGIIGIRSIMPFPFAPGIAHARAGLTRYLDFILSHEDYQRAGRYGYSPTAQDRFEEQIRAAVAAKEWDKVAELSLQLRAGQN